MINVGIYEPGGFTASSHYRSYGPLRHLKDVIITELNRSCSVHSLYTLDVFFAARPYEEVDSLMIKLAKDIGLPVWVDFDDDIWSIPHTNSAYFAYHGKIKHMNAIINMADVVTTSTQALADMVRKQTNNPKLKVVAIRNAVDKPLEVLIPEDTDKLYLGWRGTSTHTRDLEIWRSIFYSLHESKRFGLKFMGYAPPWNITYDLSSFTDFFKFRKAFAASNLTALLVPLDDCLFNRSKSNIGWLEATSIGAATFVSLNTSEWNFPGIGHDPEILLQLNNAEIQRLSFEMVSASVEAINKQFLLSDANQVRQSILNDLI